ncbi:thioredoxin-like protein [Wolfiporia cocos MD-104 SS10]|uniref:Thioredoxin-like protein n=1 Tax=Wolfiporia cocos (strain MD-104) TaxID=742152 RepID=A0A2H3JLI6_WOLCO|nr:thioredoxin-like protein [Wolfiporia cocos MD-104 SS10]
MAVNPNEDTEFNDALRKHGILPPKEPEPRTPSPPPPPALEETLEDLTLDELRELGEDAKDDETERAIEAFRRQRMAELRRQERARFGRVYPIGRDDYTREVTEASKVNPDGNPEGHGTGVVCFLYKDGIPRSDRTFEHIHTLAQRYPDSKFVSIVGDKCIPDLPDSRIPMLIIYRKGQILNQIVAWGADRERRLEELEAILILAGAIVPQVRPPTKEERDQRRGSSDDEDDDTDDEPSSRMRSAGTRTNGRTSNIRGSKKDDDSDSDFDL